MYEVTYAPANNNPFLPTEFSSLKDAISAAATLARVTPRTITRRLNRGSLISGAQVGGREIGNDGVWIYELR